MTKERIEKMLIILDEDEVRQVKRLGEENDAQAILEFVTLVISRRVEAALRIRCG